MSRVLLISTNTCVSPYAVYPLGMAVVAGALASTVVVSVAMTHLYRPMGAGT